MGVPVVTGSASARVRPTTTTDRRRELGACLRSYRERVAPAAVGLPDRGRRRTPGLRREEVAALAGVGLTWYTWLEQGRVTASDEVLAAVGGVLGIDAPGVAHLVRLSRDGAAPAATAPEELLPVLASWPGDPAALLDAQLGVVAVNDAWEAAIGRPADGHPGRRHVLWQLAADPAARARIGPDPDELLTALHRRFRMASDLDPAAPGTRGVRDVLHAEAPERAPLWECRGVGAFGRPRVRLGGVERTAYLLGEAGAPGAAVLVLLPS
ncbi:MULTISPECIES: helix-turn-helix domain-containing protein [unclassified Pseudonocardia]|uniref:helix-turn-helix domain-containing protein n=1 Tax=unclassified Pseudonocardia TaxID=2619320 RepID=UPI001CF65958|nr:MULTISPECIES: helix-turn-helix domain-containing protein [unclassified Pseudonocardia]